MKDIITYSNLSDFAYSNESICKRPIRGIVIDFFGLGAQQMFPEHPQEGKFYAERGVLYVVPYNNPWAWMNRQAIAYTDRILDVLFAQLELPEGLPVVSTGGSMGGLSALVYSAYAKRTPVACVANCPVCDLVYHYGERNDLPRTLYSAFYYEEGSLEEVLQRFSPLHLIGKLPRIDYYIFHCEEDLAVNLHTHSEKFVSEMRKNGYTVTYGTVPGRGHCDLTEEMWEKYRQSTLNGIIS